MPCTRCEEHLWIGWQQDQTAAGCVAKCVELNHGGPMYMQPAVCQFVTLPLWHGVVKPILGYRCLRQPLPSICIAGAGFGLGQTQSRGQGSEEARIQGRRPMRSRSRPTDTFAVQFCESVYSIFRPARRRLPATAGPLPLRRPGRPPPRNCSTGSVRPCFSGPRSGPMPPGGQVPARSWRRLLSRPGGACAGCP